MHKYIMLDVYFGDCERLAGPSNLRSLGDLVSESGFHMLIYPTPGEEILLRGKEIGAHLDEVWPGVMEDAEQFERLGYPVPCGRRLLALGMEELQWSLCLTFKRARVSVVIGGLVDFEFRDQRPWVEPYAQRLLGLARSLYPELFPARTLVDEIDMEPEMNAVLACEMKYINWANVFGPSYVAKYGREFLLGLPGHAVEELPDGGIFHQLSPTFVTDDLKGARALRREVIEYCAQGGLHVSCRAPYPLSGMSSELSSTLPQISDAELRAYLPEMLGVTLLLDDGTRVKPIYIEWDGLSARQRQMALDAIRGAAVEEIRQRRDGRVRFEFNSIPHDLDAMMTDLVGRENPDFVYLQVDMDDQGRPPAP